MSVRSMRGVLRVTLFAAMLLTPAGPILAVAPGDAVVTEPVDVAMANESGRADAPCSSVEEPPPPPDCEPGMPCFEDPPPPPDCEPGMPCFEEPPPPPDYPPGWLEDSTEAAMEAFVEERIAAIEAAGGSDPNEEPPPPPDYPPGWLEESTEAAMEAFVAERIAAIEAAGGSDPNEEPPPPPARPDEEPPPPCAYHMAGGANYLVIDAVVCDITQPFTVTGGKITVNFTPKAADPLGGGSYTYSGDFGKFSVSGQGTYKVKLTADGGSIVGKGPGIVKSPRGTFSAFGKERYELTPATC